MLRQAEMLVIYDMHFGVGQVQEIYEHMLSLFIGVECHLVVMLTEAKAAQCPRHEVVLGTQPSEAMFQRVASCRPKGLHNTHKTKLMKLEFYFASKI